MGTEDRPELGLEGGALLSQEELWGSERKGSREMLHVVEHS